MSEESTTPEVDVIDQVDGEVTVGDAGELGEPARVDDGEQDADEARGDDAIVEDATGEDAAGQSAGGDEDEAGAAGDGSPRRNARRAGLEREGEVAADFLETLLDIADLDGDIDLGIDGDRATVAIVDSEDGRVPRRLVGQDGKCLEALQELTRLAVQAATGERSRLMLDVAGHRAARREVLVGLANEAIGKVKESGESVSMEPMSAFERKVVHDVVLGAGLASESSGVEPRRYVVVLPA
ncbi:Jag family protein [Kribbia dieselivorans]|uniref:Jag family protein n=1 Tax=Kribbia dieselivorans TaxID=331526 RepID=UPI000837EB8B|nr:R3H domain-containing nucleic acid-binding protein [Kribbia dieselivorans]